MSWLINDPTAAVLASLFIGIVLAAAAIPKFRHPDEFQGVVANYKLLPSFLVAPVAKLLPLVELLCAVALMIPPAREIAACVAAGLFIVFALALAINVGRGRTHIDCGCVRRPTSMSRIGMFHVMRAIALAGVSLYAAAIPVEFSRISIESGMMGLAAAAMLALLYMGADMLVGFPNSKNDLLKGNTND
ncbi:MauE/DoxX family redox-associated membrane protein [Methylobacillus pratensis]|uniref:MauE/DoxX family redox-associated membrane protein n=1 Tax=Methylobacillus sp. Pita1 TaxID=3382642 RepID=UPI0038B4B54E